MKPCLLSLLRRCGFYGGNQQLNQQIGGHQEEIIISRAGNMLEKRPVVMVCDHSFSPDQVPT